MRIRSFLHHATQILYSSQSSFSSSQCTGTSARLCRKAAKALVWPSTKTVCFPSFLMGIGSIDSGLLGLNVFIVLASFSELMYSCVGCISLSFIMNALVIRELIHGH